MIEPLQVTSMRESVTRTLGPATATRQLRTETRTPTGGRDYTWAPDGDPVNCSIAPMGSRELELAGRLEVEGTVSCRVPWDFDVDEADRVVVAGTGADELDGTWEVTAVLTGSPVVDRLLYLARNAQ